jgi:hypothetical protein
MVDEKRNFFSFQNFTRLSQTEMAKKTMNILCPDSMIVVENGMTFSWNAGRRSFCVLKIHGAWKRSMTNDQLLMLEVKFK